ncbi:MAG: GNAT family N-acetyltransferase [Gaiellaceae bacterium]
MTVTLCLPGSAAEPGRRPALSHRPDVADLGQLGVEPELHGTGLGSALLDHVEPRARELGAATIVCGTAEGAARLITMYEGRGDRIVDDIDSRPATNYRSIALAKALQ